jgi:hypothetical protein
MLRRHYIDQISFVDEIFAAVSMLVVCAMHRDIAMRL